MSKGADRILGAAFLAVNTFLAGGCSTIHEETGLQIRDSVVYGIPNILSYKHETVSVNEPRLYGGLLGQMFHDYSTNFKINPYDGTARNDLAGAIGIIKSMFRDMLDPNTSPERVKLLQDTLDAAAVDAGYSSGMHLVVAARVLTSPALPDGCGVDGIASTGGTVILCAGPAAAAP